MNYERDITINQDALDVEWLEQPRLMLKYGRYMAEAELELATAKQNMEVKYAELDKDIRENPGDYGIEKIVEAGVMAAIKMNEGYKSAVKEYNECQYEYTMAKNAVKAFEHKKEALENLVRLFGQQYFSGPSVPRDLSREYQKHQDQKRADRKVAEGMKRSK